MTTTLQEFDNLDPGSLDVIFEYKCDDLLIQKDDLRQDLRWQREQGAQQSRVLKSILAKKRKLRA